MAVTRAQVALNPIQWINLKACAGGEPVWLLSDPAWRLEQSKVHRLIRRAGFTAVMMEVLDTQTLQNYRRMLDSVGLRPAPGFLQISPPEAKGLSFPRGSAEWVRWFNPVRRRAEETNFLGLDTVFLAAELDKPAPRFRKACAVGANFDQSLLDRQLECLVEAAEILQAEGIRPGLHNHVGTLIETEFEIDYTLAQIDAALLGASPDIGHLEWAGVDCVRFLGKYRDRLVDVHVKDLDLKIAAASRATPTPYEEVADQEFFLEPGLGQIDLKGAVAALGDNFDGWLIIEVDKTSKEPFESARTSWRWVERTFPPA